MASRPLKIVFSGMVAGDPYQGGATWAVLQYALGLRELGHTVILIEPVAESALRPTGSSLAESTNASYFREVMTAFSLAENAAMLSQESRATVGLHYDELVAFSNHADVIVNVSGMLTDRTILDNIPVRVYLDLDPAFIQIWHAVQGIDMRLDAHTHFATVGLALGSPTCPVPTCGRRWIKTLPPVVLSQWPRAGEATRPALTTIGNWRAYGSVELNGEFYGQKAHSVRALIDMPRRTEHPLQLAMSIDPMEHADLSALRQSGWELVDPAVVAATPDRYRAFVRGSRGELGIAKSGYVRSRCGWFSDRSACYLAAGRPVIAQETGFSDYLPTGVGLLKFTDTAEAVNCISEVNANYAAHSQAARMLAENVFDSHIVLNRLLENVGVAA